MIEEIKEALQMLSIPEKASFYPRFFKTGKGEYGEGDEFIGVTVPDQRKIVKEYFEIITLSDLKKLLSSKIHEHRHCAILMLVAKFEKSNDNEKADFVSFYLNNLIHINSWDLVDSSCYKILGRYFFHLNDDSILENLAKNDNLWQKRMAIVSTMYYIRKDKFDLTKDVVQLNLEHPHDLMHKANGWMLREMGKKNERELLEFLEKNYEKMPRTTLRYAIEKLDNEMRKEILRGQF
ncbi:DNA alkylation repair protein [Frigoriflavimonas asaccharolytica]|uniref:3-methyladenine DNA glycosylase AlkD n=1 Tax=Frigoriflavimonas asaccharolytica TaxID=2735899 RepID=A0A8J8K6N9_9FLAO|nr:DNA alkylation repair protein [Frigoriflavimonas asaccharolytica]NRS91158.1 3-methyladenine DNA glycosylase AlkD [Frigoriflavimonas asaccharolytica]